ncbi:GreA/GreB family elongation factor [Actinacidiphila paucisporea]|uniref:Transcription elongation factor, GreA/GreB family n=1 Tax=Actinacidiphila paucisporea TaxID=310782 RepID=A0A1M7NF50_9ACTN|nr:GreA/GreB family elongation factor [Actinacidiphila paucisporea]SHN02401.1 Transcription elongation factor, GreA/GreB family [Actinacidiphila paucisporea]
MTGDPEPLSPAARKALEKELSDLREERSAVAVTLRGGDSDAAGDSADQADELQRASDVTRLDNRIDEVTERLHDAVVSGPPSTDVVGVGSTVTVRFADGTTDTLHVGEVADEQDQALVTADSPLGRGLLGRRAGDAVDYETPQGPASAQVVAIGDAA